MLADQAGLTKTTVVAAERGRGVRPETARKMAAALGVKVKSIIGTDVRDDNGDGSQ